MITLKNSDINGWYFTSMVNGRGTGKCVKCGEKKEVNSFFEANNLKPHNCETTESNDEQ